MHYIIDAYNLLFSLSDEREMQQQRESLLTTLTWMAESFGNPITAVFDSHYYEGPESRCHRSKLEVVYTERGESADDYILSMVRHSKNSKICTVVTKDRKLASEIKSLGAHILAPKAFMKQLLKKQKEVPPQPLDRPQKKIWEAENERWQRLFEEKLDKGLEE